MQCVYKPVAGEQPLWDFPDGTLAGREVAAYLISEALGWKIVPPTIIRQGPAGPGMIQLWVEQPDDPDGAGLVDLCPANAVPPGYLSVLTAKDYTGAEVALVHADDPRLRRMAVFDVIINNADRKGGHVLAGIDGRVYGVDHGVSLHVHDKLRTVLWGWSAEPIDDETLADLDDLLGWLGSSRVPGCGIISPPRRSRPFGSGCAGFWTNRRCPSQTGAARCRGLRSSVPAVSERRLVAFAVGASGGLG